MRIYRVRNRKPRRNGRDFCAVLAQQAYKILRYACNKCNNITDFQIGDCTIGNFNNWKPYVKVDHYSWMPNVSWVNSSKRLYTFRYTR